MEEATALDDLLLRWDEHRARGATPTPEELCRDRPDLLERFRRRVRAVEALAPVLEVEEDTTPRGPAEGPQPSLPELPGYELLEEIGRGGMGVVYRARDPALERTVAVKALRAGLLSGPRGLQRFRQEAQVLAQLEHEHI